MIWSPIVNPRNAVAEVATFSQSTVQPRDALHYPCKICWLLGIGLIYDFDGHLLHVILHAFEHLGNKQTGL